MLLFGLGMIINEFFELCIINAYIICADLTNLGLKFRETFFQKNMLFLALGAIYWQHY